MIKKSTEKEIESYKEKKETDKKEKIVGGRIFNADTVDYSTLVPGDIVIDEVKN